MYYEIFLRKSLGLFCYVFAIGDIYPRMVCFFLHY